MATNVESPRPARQGLLKRMKSSLDRGDDLMRQYQKSKHWSLKKVKEEMQQHDLEENIDALPILNSPASFLAPNMSAPVPNRMNIDLEGSSSTANSTPLARGTASSTATPEYRPLRGSLLEKHPMRTIVVDEMEARRREVIRKRGQMIQDQFRPTGLGISGVPLAAPEIGLDSPPRTSSIAMAGSRSAEKSPDRQHQAVPTGAELGGNDWTRSPSFTQSLLNSTKDRSLPRAYQASRVDSGYAEVASKSSVDLFGQSRLLQAAAKAQARCSTPPQNFRKVGCRNLGHAINPEDDVGPSSSHHRGTQSQESHGVPQNKGWNRRQVTVVRSSTETVYWDARSIPVHPRSSLDDHFDQDPLGAESDQHIPAAPRPNFSLALNQVQAIFDAWNDTIQLHSGAPLAEDVAAEVPVQPSRPPPMLPRDIGDHAYVFRTDWQAIPSNKAPIVNGAVEEAEDPENMPEGPAIVVDEPVDRTDVVEVLVNSPGGCMTEEDFAAWINAELEPEPEPIFSCLVCLEDLPEDAFPVLVTEACAHAQDVCLECLRQSIDSQIDSEFWDQLKCPICSIKLDYDAMRAHATGQTFERYDNMSAQSTIRALADWWECPKAGCGAGGVHDQAAGPIVHCYGCDYQACFKCEVPWEGHRDLTCEQYQEQLRNNAQREGDKVKEEAEAATTVERTTKPCPGVGCGVRIEKNAGCHHMKCKSVLVRGIRQLANRTLGSRCRQQFCWDCLVDWAVILREGNDSHTVECRWHSKNIKSNPGDENYAAMVARVHR